MKHSSMVFAGWYAECTAGRVMKRIPSEVLQHAYAAFLHGQCLRLVVREDGTQQLSGDNWSLVAWKGWVGEKSEGEVKWQEPEEVKVQQDWEEQGE